MEAGGSRGPVAPRRAAITKMDQRRVKINRGWFNIAAVLQLKPQPH